MILSTGQRFTTIIGAGPYGLSAAAHLRVAGLEARVFGDPMSFWNQQMPKGMFLRSNWGASHIADPQEEFSLNAFCQDRRSQCPTPIPLNQFVEYGLWFQRRAVPELDCRLIQNVDLDQEGFQVTTSDGEKFRTGRVVVATGIGPFAHRPSEFDGIPPELASHSSENRDFAQFRGKSVIVIGAGQSAFESAALLREAGANAEVFGRQRRFHWVGLHPTLHHLGPLSRVLYSSRDVGPAGLSRLVAAPHLFRRFPRTLQSRMAHRAIRAAAAGWLAKRIEHIPIAMGRHVVSVRVNGSKLLLRFDNGMEREADHVLLATGFRVDVSRYDFLSGSITRNLRTVNGYPILKRGFESSVPGLHFLGKPAAWSFGPLLGFVSGTEFASRELLSSLSRNHSHV